MSTEVHAFSTAVRDADGHPYRAIARGERRDDGTWIGWIDFIPLPSGGVVRSSPRETTQPNLPALRYWALGLEPVYLEGALARAISASTRSGRGTRRTAPEADPPSGE
jgi:hypothetical protein